MFMAYESRVTKIGNRVRNETVVEFLSVVDLSAARNAGNVDVANTIEVVTKIASDISVCDLYVINVEKIFTRGELTFLHTSRPQFRWLKT